MPIDLKDMHSLFTSATQSKVPSSGIAFVLGLEHGECGGRKVCKTDQDEQFELHGIKITPDTFHAFELGAKVGRLKNTLLGAKRNTFGGGFDEGFGGSGSHGRMRDDEPNKGGRQ